MTSDRLLAQFDRIADAPEAIPRVRRFIVDLAVRGKLIEQDDRDESVTSLLSRIEAERIRQLKNGELKSQVLRPIGDDEIPFRIPNGWKAVRMGLLARKLGAGSTPLGGKTVYRATGIPFLRSQNVYNDGLRLDDVAMIPREVHERMAGTHIQHNDILLNITGASIGRCALVPSDFEGGNVSQHVAIIRLICPAIREFIHLSLISPFFQKVIDDVQVGVSREGLSMQRLRQFPMLIPPLAEQQRIVAKVDELMALCDLLQAAQAEREARRDATVRASLARLNQPTADFSAHVRFHLNNLPRFTTRPDQIPAVRQTIFNLAVRGRLVPQEAKDGPAAKLLGRDRLLLSLESEPFKLPAGWAWSSLQLLGEIVGGGTPSKGNADFWTGSIPWVSPKDMKVDLIADAQDHISESAIQYSSTRRIPKGSLLMVVRGMILAHSFPTAISSVAVTINQDMKAIVPFRPDLAKFLLLITKGMKREVLKLVQRSTHGTCKLLSHDLFTLPLPIPPLAEQHLIVAKVDELMAVCDELESQLATAQTERRRLLEAILHEALRSAAFDRTDLELSSARATVPMQLTRSLGRRASSPAGRPLMTKVGTQKKHSKGIAYRRATVAAFLVSEFRSDPNFGRTKLEKLNHLLEHHCGIDLEREPVRDAAGPNDYSALRKAESLAKKQGWFVAKQHRNRRRIIYTPGAAITARVSAARRLFGDRLSNVEALVILLRRATTRQVEIIATLYAAWNDLLLAGRSTKDDDIVRDVLENWHERKKTIPADSWLTALKWMKQKRLSPRGTGRSVVPKTQTRR
jgi:type I restriction enzyme S subunit